MRRVATVAVTAAVLAGTAAAASTDPKQMVLRASDLPAGYRVAIPFHYFRTAAAAKISRAAGADPLRKGFVRGYGGAFRNPAVPGALVIASHVSVFRTPAYAAASVAEARRYCSHAPRRRVRVGVPLGVQSVLCTVRFSSAHVTFEDVIVVWRVGRVRGELVVGARPSAARTARVVRLAQLQASRMG